MRLTRQQARAKKPEAQTIKNGVVLMAIFLFNPSRDDHLN
jgi:hypothetical protein